MDDQSCPRSQARNTYKDNRVGHWVPGSNTVSEIELGGIEAGFQIVPSDNLVDGNAHERVMFRRTSVIDVVGPFRRNSDDSAEQGQEVRLHLDRATNNLLTGLSYEETSKKSSSSDLAARDIWIYLSPLGSSSTCPSSQASYLAAGTVDMGRAVIDDAVPRATVELSAFCLFRGHLMG